jgi:hypothetical protein
MKTAAAAINPSGTSRTHDQDRRGRQFGLGSQASAHPSAAAWSLRASASRGTSVLAWAGGSTGSGGLTGTAPGNAGGAGNGGGAGLSRTGAPAGGMIGWNKDATSVNVRRCSGSVATGLLGSAWLSARRVLRVPALFIASDLPASRPRLSKLFHSVRREQA